ALLEAEALAEAARALAGRESRDPAQALGLRPAARLRAEGAAVGHGCLAPDEAGRLAEAAARAARAFLAGRAADVAELPAPRMVVLSPGDDGEPLDFGDLPDARATDPSTRCGYPTLRASDGARHRASGKLLLGDRVDLEPEARLGGAGDPSDDGVRFFPDRLEVTVTSRGWAGPAYLNVLQNLDRSDDALAGCRPGYGLWDAPRDWVVRNRRVELADGERRVLHLPVRVRPRECVRVTLTDHPLTGYTGRGALGEGETEDHCRAPSPPAASAPAEPAPPLVPAEPVEHVIPGGGPGPGPGAGPGPGPGPGPGAGGSAPPPGPRPGRVVQPWSAPRLAPPPELPRQLEVPRVQTPSGQCRGAYGVPPSAPTTAATCEDCRRAAYAACIRDSRYCAEERRARRLSEEAAGLVGRLNQIHKQWVAARRAGKTERARALAEEWRREWRRTKRELARRRAESARMKRTLEKLEREARGACRCQAAQRCASRCVPGRVRVHDPREFEPDCFGLAAPGLGAAARESPLAAWQRFRRTRWGSDAASAYVEWRVRRAVDPGRIYRALDAQKSEHLPRKRVRTPVTLTVERRAGSDELIATDSDRSCACCRWERRRLLERVSYRVSVEGVVVPIDETIGLVDLDAFVMFVFGLTAGQVPAVGVTLGAVDTIVAGLQGDLIGAAVSGTLLAIDTVDLYRELTRGERLVRVKVREARPGAFTAARFARGAVVKGTKSLVVPGIQAAFPGSPREQAIEPLLSGLAAAIEDAARRHTRLRRIEASFARRVRNIFTGEHWVRVKGQIFIPERLCLRPVEASTEARHAFVGTAPCDSPLRGLAERLEAHPLHDLCPRGPRPPDLGTPPVSGCFRPVDLEGVALEIEPGGAARLRFDDGRTAPVQAGAGKAGELLVRLPLDGERLRRLAGGREVLLLDQEHDAGPPVELKAAGGGTALGPCRLAPEGSRIVCEHKEGERTYTQEIPVDPAASYVERSLRPEPAPGMPKDVLDLFATATRIVIAGTEGSRFQPDAFGFMERVREVSSRMFGQAMFGTAGTPQAKIHPEDVVLAVNRLRTRSARIEALEAVDAKGRSLKGPVRPGTEIRLRARGRSHCPALRERVVVRARLPQDGRTLRVVLRETGPDTGVYEGPDRPLALGLAPVSRVGHFTAG
ncbi:MAG TPA: hypothetical protein ENK20_08600, partial [Chromatiales bacterium]|nr:hypothetical protein [Chromatiales bacterium]